MYARNRNNFRGGYQADYHGRLIASKTLKLETKRYYIDVKETDRFMFLKLTEIETGGRKSKITLDLQSAADFHFMLTEFNEFYTNLGPRTSNAGRRDEMAPLKSDSFASKDRKIFLDLKENKWGRFLKVTMTVSLGREKHKLIIPAQGMTELIDAFTELLREADAKIKKGDAEKEKKNGDEKEEEDKNTVDSKSNNVDQDEKRELEKEEREGKRKHDTLSSSEQGGGGDSSVDRNDKKTKKSHLSYGDQYLEVNVNKNSRGTFLRITEVNDNIEKSVSVPQEFWMNFLKKLKKSINDNNVDATDNNNNNENVDYMADQQQQHQQNNDHQQQQQYFNQQQQQQYYEQQSNNVFESSNNIDLVNINE